MNQPICLLLVFLWYKIIHKFRNEGGFSGKYNFEEICNEIFDSVKSELPIKLRKDLSGYTHVGYFTYVYVAAKPILSQEKQVNLKMICLSSGRCNRSNAIG